MKSYKYELVVWEKEITATGVLHGVKVKRFIGNDTALLTERFEMWFIKQGYSREEIYISIGEIQHINY